MKKFLWCCLLSLPALVSANNSITIKYHYDTLAFDYSIEGNKVVLTNPYAYDYFGRTPLKPVLPELIINGRAEELDVTCDDCDLDGLALVVTQEDPNSNIILKIDAPKYPTKPVVLN